MSEQKLPTRTFMEILAVAQDDAFKRDPVRHSLGAKIATAVRETLADLDATTAALKAAQDEVATLKALLAEGVGLHVESSPDCTCTFNMRARAALATKEPR